MANGDVLIRVGNAKAATPIFSPRINAAGYALAVALGTPSLLAGSGTAPAGQTVTVSLGTPTIVVSSSVSPTGYSLTASRGSVTFSLGADVLVRVGAGVIAAPVFTSGAAHSPTGFGLTASVGTPTPSVINGANPTGFSMAATASGAGIDIDAAVGPDGYGLTMGLGTPSVAGVGGDNSVFPTGQTVTVSLGTPVVGVSVTPTGFQVESDQSLTNSPFSISELNWWPPIDGSLGPPGGPIWNNGKNPSIDLDPAVVVTNTQAPTGLSATASLGTPTVDISSSQTDALVPVVGFGLTLDSGLGGTTWPITHDATLSEMTVGFGTAVVVVDDAETPSGYGLTTGLGVPQVTVDNTTAVSGFGLTADLGTPDTSGNITVRPTGFRLVTSLGMVAIGGTDLTRPLLVQDISRPRYGVRDLSGPRYEVDPLAHSRYAIQEITMSDTLYFGNDDEFEFYLSRRNSSTGEVEPAAGLGSLTCHLSATETGATIHANLSVTAAERSGAPGYYYGVMQGSDIATHLAAYENRSVYRILSSGTDVKASERVRVRARRPIV